MFFKRTIKILFFSAVVMSLLSCFSKATDNNAENPTDSSCKVKFSIQSANPINSSILCSSIENDTIAKVVLKYRHADSNEEKTANITLKLYGGKYVTEDVVTLNAGEYYLTRFDVLNTDGLTIYSTPKTGSFVANSIGISTSLEYSFTVTAYTVNTVVMQVVEVEDDTDPADFGFEAFTFEMVNYNKFYIKALLLDENDKWEYATADLTIKTDSTQTNAIIETELKKKPNRIFVDGYSNYHLTVSRLGYHTQSFNFSAEALKLYTDENPLEIKLLRKPGMITRKELVRFIANGADVSGELVNYITDLSYLMNSVAAYLGEDITSCSVVQNFDQNISGWDVSNVTDMSHILYYAKAFNQDISNWDISSVTNFSCFDDSTSTTWTSDKKPKFKLTKADLVEAIAKGKDVSSVDVSAITDMSGLMEAVATYKNESIKTCSIVQNFNQDINSWDVSNVTDMSYMFNRAYHFNQPLNNWNVNNVTNMSHMFHLATSFNQDIGGWNVSNVTDMSHMFEDANVLNDSLNEWDVSNVTNMSYMFCSAGHFNQPLNKWNVNSVTDMSYMFLYASYFDQPLNEWNVSSVTNMEAMFAQSIRFNKPLNDWIVSSVTNMEYMFYYAKEFNQDISGWSVDNVTNHEEWDVGTPSSWTDDEKPAKFR